MNALVDFLVAFGEPHPGPARLYSKPWESFHAEPPFFTIFISYPTDNLNCFTSLSEYENAFWRLWVLGEIYDAELTPKKRMNDATQGIRCFLADSPQSGAHAHSINGHFVAFGWDKAQHNFHVWTNRFGTMHVYYASNGREAAIGTFFPAVSAFASQHELDWVGLTGYFSCGFFPGDKTFFTSTQILRPASHYVFTANGRILSQERYWHWQHTPDEHRTFDDTVAEFADIFHQVMDDHTSQGRVAVPISGGLDSRSTVAAITRPGRTIPEGVSLWSYSYGYSEDSVETHIAGKVADARKLPFQSFTIRPYLFDRIEHILSLTEGFQDITQCRQMFVRDEIASNADVLISALWGDVWLDDMGLVDRENPVSDSEIVSHIMNRFHKRGRHWLLDNLCRPQMHDNPDCILEEVIKEELNPLNSIEDPDFRVKALKMESWSFRWSLPPIRIFQSAATPKLVFYDTRLADFFATVPSSYVKQRMLQIEYLRRFAPDLARITWQAYDANLYHYPYFHSLLLPKRTIKKAWRVLTRKHILQRNWEVQFLCPEGRAGLEKWLLSPGLPLHEFVPHAKVKQLVEEFYRNPWEDGYGYTISMLLTFSAWLEIYG